jgi:hypothetical protein
MDTGVHSEHVLVIKCDFKLGSVERCRDVKNGRYHLVGEE